MSNWIKDYQKSKVYKWENRVIAPQDTGIVKFEDINPVVQYIWAGEGLKYPPVVVPLLNDSALARGGRLQVSFKPDKHIFTWVILHELAHSMTSDMDYTTNGHGEDFVGVYMKLVSKYMHINILELMAGANAFKVNFNISAVPLLKRD